MSDLIDRQAAIDAILEGLAFDSVKELRAYVSKNKQNNYFYGGVLHAINAVQDLPSAQPEIIRCKECKHYEGGWYCSAWNNSPGFPMVTEEGYCDLAERRTDEDGGGA